MKIIFNIFIFLLFCFSLSAQHDTLKYIFLGHTYQYYTAGNKVDERFKNIDLDEYDGVWHGGDLCSESLMRYSTIEYIDSVFNLKSEHTHWALGNHDSRNPNWNWVEDLTGRKTYYTSHANGITYIILNTSLTPYNCEDLDAQYKIIVDVCDTITNSSHLVMLMHHGIWKDVPGLPSPGSYAFSNLVYYNFNCYSVESTYAKEIYPRLLEVKKRGIEVISILGDTGQRKVEFISDDGLHFLGTGLYKSKYQNPEERANAPTDYALIFKHEPSTGWMEWEFIDFDKLSGY